MKSKGKEISGKASTSKRKRNDTDKSGGRKKKTPGVLQFFDVSADVDKDEDLSEDDDFERDFMDGLDTEPKGKNESGKAHHIPFLPKEEEISDDELERLLEERYRPGSRNVVYAEDEYDTKGSGDKISLLPSLNDPIIWRVKCMVGRERQTAFCLMQKYVDVQSIGTKLKIASAFVLEHIKGHIYIEADRESDIVEACKGICSIYSSRMSRVPTNEVHHLFSLRNTSTELSKGTWVRVKYGNYKGDLAQVVAVDDSRKKTTVKRATVKIIPRIDLQALAKKLGGGGTVKQTDVPVPRLISSTELEDFRPHIQSKRDRQSGMVFESLDGLMLKDGYLYKRVPIESLTYLDVLPSAMELQKFRTSSKDASDNMEWLSNLYGEQQKKSLFKCGKGTTKGEGKGTTKGEGTSGTTKGDGFELHDLVFFGRKDFGVIIGVEDDNFQILKHGVDEEEVVTVEHHEIKNGSFDKKFTALDQNMKTVSVNDTVRVLEGPLKDKQGIVRQIYRGTIFIYDENQLENGGYFCAKAQLCEKISHSIDAHQENIGDESGAAGFEDATSPNKPWQAKENRRDFNGRRQEDREGDFSIGQSLRIRVGDLKGHLCRVIAIYRSEVTVKVDSKMNIIKVKREHLSEAGVKSMWGPECNTTKPFDAFGTQGSSGGLGEGSGTLAESNGWNSAVPSTGRSSWPDFPASSGFLLDSTFSNPFGSLDNDDDPKKGKDEEDDPWGSKVASKKATDIWNKAIDVGADLKSSWSKPTSEGKLVDAKLDQVDNWGKSTDSWNKPTANNTGFGSNVTDSWGTGKLQIGSSADRSSDAMGSWGKKNSTSNDPEPAWGKGKSVIGNETGAWGKAVENQGKENPVNLNQEDSWGKASESWKAKDGSSGSKTSAWGKPVEIQGTENTVKSNQEDSWGKASDSWKAKDASSGSKTGAWGKPVEIQGKENTVKSNPEDSWGKASDGWKAKDGSSGSKTGGWNNASASQGNQSGGWGNNSTGGCTQTESARIDRVSSWNNAGGATDGEGANMASVWNKGTATGTGDGGWNRSKGTDGDQEFGWNKGRMGNKEGDEDKDQHSTWGRPSFDGGRGSGGRRGRGGFRGGNRGNFNGGRSFGRGRSSGWNKDDEQRGTGDGESSGRPSSGWSNDRADDWNKTKAFDGDQQNAGGNGNQGGDGWGKPRSGDDYGSNWNKGRAAEHTDGDKGFSGNNSSGWNNNEGNNWSASKASVGKQSSGWTKELVTKEESGGNQSSGWDSKANNWNKTEGNSSSGWNQGLSATNKGTGGRGNEGFDWNKRNASSEDQGSGWKSGTSDTGGNPLSGWDTKASNWNNSKGKQSSGSNPGLSENDETGGSGEQSSGWGSKNISNTQKDSSGHQTSAWDSNKGFASNEDVWNRKKASDGGGQATGWKSGATNETTGWNKGNAFGGGDRSSSWSKGPNTTDGNEDRSNNWNKTTFGNGDDGDNNNWRGGKFFRGGGRSSGWNRGSNADNDGDPVDSSDQPRGFGRGQSFGSGRGGGFGDRGRGRGGSFGDRGRGRGGFGGRGRGRGGRDQSGGWNREKTDGEDQSVGWSSKDTADNAGDWGSNDRSGSWNQGGGGRGKGQWQNWNKESGATKETGGTSSQGGGWNDKGSGWNQSSGGTSDGNNGWKSSQGSGWNGGTTGLAKEGSETKVKANNWNQSCTPDGWKKGPDSTKDDFGTNDGAGGGWNSQGSGNRESDSWNRPNPSVGPASSDWNKPMVAKETGGSWDQAATKDGSSGWNKEEGSVKAAGGPNKQAGGWNSQGSGNGSNAPVGPTSSGWNKPTVAKETSGGWDQATKKDGSGGKGGW